MDATGGGGHYTDILRDIVSGFQDLVRSEIHLAKAETKQTVDHFSRRATSAAIFGVIALGGLLPLLAFFVIGLGDLFGGRYWLSSLLVAAVMIGVGGYFAKRSVDGLKERDMSLPLVRQSLKHEKNSVKNKIEDIRDRKRRLA